MNNIKNKILQNLKSPIILLISAIATVISVFFAVLIALGVGENFLNNNEANQDIQLNAIPSENIEIIAPNGKKIFVEIADDNTERQRGLMFRDYLPEDAGMLFVFEKEQTLNFWMKNTYIPLDIIFLDADKKVVKIHTNTMPNQTTEIYSSEKPAKYTLEVNAFWTEKNGIKIGDRFIW
ncbi:MAG: hypothetical protein KatS3mg085_426 [Candidatus Dojkabacteria bacterium]|nr:MAG: hypothetical protein KatS3mg085_426 [Candidatus Dojkabacteria bacterium]